MIGLIIRSLWMVQHGISVFLLSRKFWLHFVIFSLLIFTFIYVTKPDTADIPNYTRTMDNLVITFFTEPGFVGLGLLAKVLAGDEGMSLEDNRRAVLYIQLFTALLFLGLIRKFEFEKSIEKWCAGILVISSLAFSLGVNNALRQAISSVFLVLALFSYVEEKKGAFIFWSLVATVFHNSAVLFIGMILIALWFLRREFFYEGASSKGSQAARVLSKPLVYSGLLLGSVVGVVLLYILLPRLPFFGSYFQKNYAATSHRVASYIKVIPIFFLFLLSEWSFGKDKREWVPSSVFRMLRVVFMLFVLILSSFSFFTGLFDEAVARILYFYYVIEMVLLLFALKKGVMLPIVIISLGYAFAINAMNILGGAL